MLKLNDIFDKFGEIILGKHELFDSSDTGRQPADVIQEVMADKSLPLLDGFDCCHTHPMLTLPPGVPLSIDFDKSTVAITGKYLS